MRHNWILEVLADLRIFADKNDLPAIADAAAQALTVAHTEIAARLANDRLMGDIQITTKRPN